jgi:hypothetical protein
MQKEMIDTRAAIPPITANTISRVLQPSEKAGNHTNTHLSNKRVTIWLPSPSKTPTEVTLNLVLASTWLQQRIRDKSANVSKVGKTNMIFFFFFFNWMK